ncbi:flavin-binding monooxygenase [Aspergillus luchuensis]|uniref:Flavin-binding monooxygenase n=1 Tax=Aspergillus kawachii TaxID=1069201 RepID=A0A146FKD9_ASPKA|nr:flavin-binding monooxygenase [Aspergillus luchuensis]
MAIELEELEVADENGEGRLRGPVRGFGAREGPVEELQGREGVTTTESWRSTMKSSK